MGSVKWALMFGNFVIGCGVMSVAGTLNDIAHSLQVSVALAGQLITIAAATMAFGAPLLAGWVAGFDRRRLLALALLWYGAGHAISALMPSYAALWPVRAVTMLAAAVFTPQAAAAIGFMAAPKSAGARSPSSSWAGRSHRCWACRCRHGWARPSAGAWPSMRSLRWR